MAEDTKGRELFPHDENLEIKRAATGSCLPEKNCYFVVM